MMEDDYPQTFRFPTADEWFDLRRLQITAGPAELPNPLPASESLPPEKELPKQ